MRTTNKYLRKVIACEDCKGVGEILVDTGTHSKVYEKQTCKTCNGYGRLIRKTTIEYEPYNEDHKVMVRI